MSAAPIKLLSIDDRSMTTDLDHAGYRSMGVSVKNTKTFLEANQAIKNEKIDLLVINNDYKKIDAVAICKHLKSLEETKHLPLVVTSVQSNAAKRDAILSAGADLFVEQPIPRQHFIEKMKRLLSQMTRAHDRVSILGNVTLVYEGEAMQCAIGDISTTGILANTGMEMKVGTRLELTIHLADMKKPLQMQGEVVRILKPSDAKKSKKTTNPIAVSGLGIKFVDVNEDLQSKIKQHMTSHSSKQKDLSYYL